MSLAVYCNSDDNLLNKESKDVTIVIINICLKLNFFLNLKLFIKKANFTKNDFVQDSHQLQ